MNLRTSLWGVRIEIVWKQKKAKDKLWCLARGKSTVGIEDIFPVATILEVRETFAAEKKKTTGTSDFLAYLFKASPTL